MQTAFTNIYERIGHPQGLSEFQGGPVIRCYLCKSIHEKYEYININY